MIERRSYVYHEKLNANGFITEVNTARTRDIYKVMFLWGKYANGIQNGTYKKLGVRSLWQWCAEEDLHVIGIHPYDNVEGFDEDINNVSMLGNRSLDRLVRSIIGIDCYEKGDWSDIVINYGTFADKVIYNRDVLVLNSHLISNKYEQQKLLGTELGIESHYSRPGEPNPNDWIVKPEHSMGGRGIRKDNGIELRTGEYFQRRFNKVKEYRAHCFLWANNPVPLIQEKKIENTEQLCWNKKQGGHFWYPYREGFDSENTLSMEFKDKITELSIKALKAIKYDFGGIDFGMDSDGNLKIFEVNSRMGLREKSFAVYFKPLWELFFLNIDEYKEKRGW